MNLCVYGFVYLCMDVFVAIHKYINVVLWFCGNAETHKNIVLIISPIHHLQ